LRDFLDNIPFGKAPLLLFILFLLTGGWLLLNPVDESEADVEIWTFEHSRNEVYEEKSPDFEEDFDATVEVQSVEYLALQNRLRSAFWANLEVPDLVELEISHAGGFFRGETDQIGFRDLTPYLERNNLQHRIVSTRFAPYRHKGSQFGLPLDIHPVMIAYRRDKFEEFGIDPESLKTWDDFIEAGRRATEEGERFMIQLADSRSAHFDAFLLQNGGAYFNEAGDLTIDDPVTLETLLMYIPMVAGPDRIGTDLGTDQAFTQALEEGYFLCVLAPDYMATHISLIAPRVKGKMALMPLPAFEPGGRRTSTMGGSMIAITKGSEKPELAWDFIEYFWLDEETLEERFRATGIIPPFKDAWDMGAFQEKHPYWSDQRVGRLYASLAEEVPPQYASPFISDAKAAMGSVVSSCAAYYRSHGDDGFEEFARNQIEDAAAKIRHRMQRNPFE